MTSINSSLLCNQENEQIFSMWLKSSLHPPFQWRCNFNHSQASIVSIWSALNLSITYAIHWMDRRLVISQLSMPPRLIIHHGIKTNEWFLFNLCCVLGMNINSCVMRTIHALDYQDVRKLYWKVLCTNLHSAKQPKFLTFITNPSLLFMLPDAVGWTS